MSIILQALNISKSYSAGQVKVEALKQTNLDIPEGSINVIIGRSGSGKSTLLKVLGGLVKPDSGQVMIENQLIYSINEASRARLRSLQVGFVFQEFNLISELSVLNNIRLPFNINNRAYDQQAEREMIGMLDLKDRLNFYPDQLSGGERQRTAIARALLMKPSIILMDEPTGSLDTGSGKNVMDFVESSNRLYHQTYLVVSHHAEWHAIAHEVYRMSDGQLSKEK